MHVRGRGLVCGADIIPSLFFVLFFLKKKKNRFPRSNSGLHASNDALYRMSSPPAPFSPAPARVGWGPVSTCVYSVSHFPYEVVCTGRLGRCHHLSVLTVPQTIGNIVLDRTGEQHRLLPHQNHLCRADRNKELVPPAVPPLLSSGWTSAFLPRGCPISASRLLLSPAPPSLSPLPPGGAGSDGRTPSGAGRPAAAGPRWAGTGSAAEPLWCSSLTHWVPPTPSPLQDAG